jgi:putative PIN family toxin of toxin-antitoxin system
MNIILDTSTIITLLLSTRNNYTRDIVRLATGKKITFVTCKEALNELKTTIATDKFKTYTTHRNHLVGQFVNMYQHTAHIIDISNIMLPSDIKLRDKTDELFVKIALASNANYLISLDNDLLALGTIGQTQVVTPARFHHLRTFASIGNVILVRRI